MVNNRDNSYECNDDVVVPDRASNLFNIGQCYETTAAETQVCPTCGGNEFHVGIGSHYTAVMCIKCKKEGCVHDG